MTPHAIEIRIDELVLHGFSPADRLQIGAAFERELARLVAEQGVPVEVADSAHREVIEACSFEHSSLATPGSLGTDLARAVNGRLWT